MTAGGESKSEGGSGVEPGTPPREKDAGAVGQVLDLQGQCDIGLGAAPSHAKCQDKTKLKRPQPRFSTACANLKSAMTGIAAI